MYKPLSNPFWFRLIFAVFLILAATCAQSQTVVRWDLGSPGGAGAATTQGSGLPLYVALPGAQLNWCNHPANAVPCTNYATTYSSISGASSCPTNAQIVLQGSSTCVATGDNFGNIGLYTQTGNFDYTLTYNGQSFGPYVVSVGGGSGGGGGFTPGLAGQQVVTNPGASALVNQTKAVLDARDFPGILPAGNTNCTLVGPNYSGCVDSSSALQAFANSACLGTTTNGASIVLPKNQSAINGIDYYSSQRILWPRGCQVAGVGNGVVERSTVIAFAAGSAGFVCADGGGCSFSNLSIMGGNPYSSGTVPTISNADGIQASSNTHIDNVLVAWFGRHGVMCASDLNSGLSGWPTQFDSVIANGVQSVGNLGDGFHCSGNDGESGTFVSPQASGNQGYGFNDTSLYGNIWLWANATGNGTGFNAGGHGQSGATFIRPYAESNGSVGQFCNSLICAAVYEPQGQVSLSTSSGVAEAPLNVFKQYQEGMFVVPANSAAATGDQADLHIAFGWDEDAFGMGQWWGNADPASTSMGSGHEYSFLGLRRNYYGSGNNGSSNASNCWAFMKPGSYNGALATTSICLPDNLTNFQRSAVSAGAFMPNGFYLGSLAGNYIPTNYFGVGTAAPISGSWLVGDTIINSNPTSGAVWGWRNVSAGTPGTWEALSQASSISGLNLTVTTGTAPLTVASTTPVANLSLAGGAGTSVTSATGSFGSIKDTGVTGSVQCIHADASGNLTGTGSDCSGGGGGGGTVTHTVGALGSNILEVGNGSADTETLDQQTNKYADIPTSSAPANPSSGYQRIYSNSSTNMLACLTSGGASCLANGTVTSIGLTQTAGTGFTITSTPITTSGNINLAWTSESANLFLASPNGSSGTPVFRAIAGADLPPINLASSINGGVTGNLPVANLNSGTSASSTTFWRGDGTWAAPSGSGTVNNALQYAGAYYSTSGTSNFISGVSAPTSPNGVPQSWVSIPSSGAVAPTWLLPGISGRAVTGTTSTDTIASTDCSNRVQYTGSVAVAITLPTATTLAVPACAFRIVNRLSTLNDLTITSTTWTCNGNSTCVLHQGQLATIYVDPAGTNWQADIQEQSQGAGSNITFTRSSTGVSIAGNAGTVTAFSAGNFSPLFTTSVTTSTTTPALTFTASTFTANQLFGNPTGSTAAPIAFGVTSPLAFAASALGCATCVTSASVLTDKDLVAGSGGAQGTASATAHNVAIPLVCADTTGTGTAGVCSTSPSFTIAANDCITYTTTTANTGALTWAVNGGSAATVQKWQGTALAANDILANRPYPACFDGTHWQVTTIGNAPASGGTVTSVAETVNSGSSSGIFAVTGSPVTTSGTLNINLSGTSGGHPYFSSSTVLSSSTAGTTHGVWLAQGAGSADNTTGTGATGTVLHGQGGSADPSFSAVSLTADVSGILPLANMTQLFQTNAQTATYQVLAADFADCKTIPVASGTFTITLVASGSQPASGQCLTVLNYGSGVVTIARSGQNINGGTTSLTLNAGSASAPTSAYIVSDGTNYFATIDEATVGTVTSVATTAPLGGGTITGSGTLTCTTCVTSSSPGAGIAHFAGSTQAVTSSAVVDADVSFTTPAIGAATATTQTAGDNSTKVATTAYTNTEYTLVQTSGSPYTLLGLSGYYWNNSGAAYTFQLDAPVAGKQYCFGNYSAETHAITVKSTTSVYIVYKGANGTVTTGTLVSGGAAGDFTCMVGVDTTHYMVTGAGYGTWTNN